MNELLINLAGRGTWFYCQFALEYRDTALVGPHSGSSRAGAVDAEGGSAVNAGGERS